MKKKLANLILKKYFTLSHPASYSGIPKFKKSLEEEGINVSYNAIRNLLKNNLHYVTNFIKRKKFKTRHLYSDGYGIECYSDTCFLTVEKGVQFKFLLLCDNHTRYVYGAPLEGLKPGGPSLDSLKKAFARILKRSPQWAIIRVDRDPAITALKLRTLLRNISF